jgi:hypothetical protein
MPDPGLVVIANVPADIAATPNAPEAPIFRARPMGDRCSRIAGYVVVPSGKLPGDDMPTLGWGVMGRRPYGSGTLYVKAGSWYGRWRTAGGQVNRKLGPVHPQGSRDGLPGAGAERELRRRMDSERVPGAASRLTVAEAVAKAIDSAEA